MRRLLFFGLIALAAFSALVYAGNLGWGPLVITREGEQKLVLVFGNVVSTLTKPGLSLRVPLISDVVTFDQRRLYLNAEPLPIQTRDEERIVVDDYVIWRIADPQAFYVSFPTGLPQAEAQIDRVVRADLREVVGRRTLAEILTTARSEIMESITRQSDGELRPAGIAIDDVRLNRTELPPGTEKNVYERMRTERERLARKLRAEGDEQGRRIRAQADGQARVIVAEATRDADIARGQGDAEAARIYAEAYSSDPEFYGFVRSLEAYKKTLGPGTTLVLPPSAEFFRLLESEGPRR